MKTLKRVVGYTLIVGSSIVALALLTGHEYLYKGIKEVWLRGWSSGNIDDLKYAYDTRVLTASDPIPWPEDLRVDEIPGDTIEKWMEDELTASFLVVHRDTVIFEKYWRGHDETTLTNSFSMAKQLWRPWKAVDDGLVDVHAPIYTYIPDLRMMGSSITVEHLLRRTCIPFGEGYSNPFGFPQSLCGGDIQGHGACRLKRLRTAFLYQSGNNPVTEILNVGKSITNKVSDNIWGPIHAENNAEWFRRCGWTRKKLCSLLCYNERFRKVWQAFARPRKSRLNSSFNEEYVKDMLTPTTKS